ncbi:MAG TPA: DUF1345 domain-containing protein [Candidatus Baltobacteraceae bacterium]
MKNYGYLARAAASIAVAGVVLLVIPARTEHVARAVAAYDAGALVLLLAEWLFAMHRDPTHTRRYAANEDPGRNVAFFLVLVSVAAGLVAAVMILGGTAGHIASAPRVVTYVLAFGAVVLGWLLIQTTFTFRYAHAYYRDANRDSRADGGLKFPGEVPPSYYDFAYFSFVIGMTFQVSDVQITAPRIRRMVLAHGLISFGYSVTIVALTVNVIASILQGR